MLPHLSQLRPDFVWGVAAASHQIEGDGDASGKGLSSWDVFERRPGAIFEGQHARRASDHYHRWQEDLDLLAELGVAAYRLSISWPRVLPNGVGAPNPKGLGFYSALIDGLLQRDITPYVTLFHWDTPYALERQGGFLNERMPLWFADYAAVVVGTLGDRVRHWFTLNEPHAFIEGGLGQGRHAPGHRLSLGEVLRAGHHALLAHGAAVRRIREIQQGAWVAMAPVLVCATPESHAPADVEAARSWTFSQRDSELRTSAWWMDPVFGYGYPADGLTRFGALLPSGFEKDLDDIAEPLDACAFNLYDAAVVRADAAGNPELCAWPPGAPRTAFGWPVTPEAHYWGPRFAQARYHAPIFIAENGLSTRDWVALDGRVHDPDRIDFLLRHLLALERSAMDGVDVEGYFHWSLMDNYEWNHGYRERFGLVYVDYQTFERTKKDSFFAYRDIVRSHRRSG